MHESAPCKSMSQDVGTQTSCPAEFSSCNLHPEHPFTTAHLAEALAEGTRLLMAAPESTAPKRQQTTQLPAGIRATPWTLLTQSNIQLRLKPVVAMAGTQTEDMGLSDQPSDSTVGAAAASRHAPQGEPKSTSVSAAQLATSAALPMPSQPSYTTATSLPPVASARKNGKGVTPHQAPSSSRAANRQASRIKRSPNAHLMFQCQVGPFPYDTFAPAVPTSSCQPQTVDCLTPARPSNSEKRRRSSVSCLSPPLTTSALQPAADTAADHGQAATSAADPLEIQLAEAGTSCKSAITTCPPPGSAPPPVKKPSQAQPSMQAQGLAGNYNVACLHSSPQSDKATALTNASETSTTRRVNVFPSVHPDKADIKNSTDGAAASAAAAPKASHATPGSKAATAIKPALPDAPSMVSLSPQTIQASVAAYPASPAQEPAQRHGQDDAQTMINLASASPAQAASHHSLGRTLPGPKAPTTLLVPLALGPLPEPYQAADAPPGNHTQALPPFSPTHKAASSSQQGRQLVTATMTKGNPNAAAVAVCAKAATQTAPSSPSQVRARGKSHIQSQAQQQLEAPSTADALRSDLISTAGCHVTRRLVQHLLEPISQPVTGATACSQPTRGSAGGAGHTMAKGTQPSASKGRSSGHSQATEAGRTESAQAVCSSQPVQANKATDTEAASITSKGQVPNADHSKQANQSKQAGKDKHRLPELKAVAVKERQQSMPPVPTPTEKATQPKEASQKVTDAKLETKHASRAKAGKTRSILELNQSQTAPAVAVNLGSDRKKTGSSTAAGKCTVNTSTADTEKAHNSNNKVIASGASKPNGSVTESKESQPSALSASQAQSGFKRLRSDASAVASAPAKRPKVSHPVLY